MRFKHNCSNICRRVKLYFTYSLIIFEYFLNFSCFGVYVKVPNVSNADAEGMTS